MRRAVDQTQGAELRPQSGAFLEYAGAEGLHRQSLRFGNVRLAKKADGRFAGGEPVAALAIIAEQGDVHFTIEFFDVGRTDVGQVVKQPRVARSGAGHADVA